MKMIKNTVGFTMVEVVVAIGILGLLITPVLALFVGSARNAARSGDYTVSVMLAREKIEEIKGLSASEVEKMVGESPLKESLIIDNAEYRTVITLLKTDPAEAFTAGGEEENNQNLYHVQVRVKWGERDAEAVVMEYLLFRN